MRGPFFGASTALAIVLAAAGARAQQAQQQSPIPVTIPHVGRLLGPSDQPLTGAHTLTFKIYDAATGGNVVWTAQYPVTLGNDGTYDLSLGDAEHPFDLSKLAGGARWMGVALDTQPEFSPRQAFGSVLYALRALEAQNVKGGTVDGVSITNATIEAPTITGGTFSGGTITDAQIAATSVSTPSLVAQKITVNGGSIDGVKVNATEINLNGKPVGADSVSKAGDTMTGPLTATKFVATTTSEAPLQVASTQLVQGLNAELHGGHPVDDFVLKTDVRSNQNLVHNASIETFSKGDTQPPNWFQLQAALGSSSSLRKVTGYDGASAVSLLDQDFAARVVLKQVIYPQGGAALGARTFTARVAYRKQSGGATIKGQLCLADTGADNQETNPGCVALDGTSDWKVASVTYTTSANPSYLKVYFSSTIDPAEAAEYQFDQLAVVEGSYVPYFAPHAEDFLTGMVGMFQNACPRGWSEVTDLRGRFPRGEVAGNPASLDFGGSDDETLVAHTHTVTGTVDSAGSHLHRVQGNTDAAGDHAHRVAGGTSTNGAHGHQIQTRNDDFNCTGDNSGAGYFGVSRCADNGYYNWPTYNMQALAAGDHAHSFDVNSYNAGSHAHSLTIDSQAAGAHTHTFSATTASSGGSGVGKNVPAYKEVIFCSKD